MNVSLVCDVKVSAMLFQMSDNNQRTWLIDSADAVIDYDSLILAQNNIADAETKFHPQSQNVYM